MAEELVFEDLSGSDYTLFFSRDDTITSPIYDINTYKDKILQESIDALTIGEIHMDEPEKTPMQHDFKFAYYTVIILLAILLFVLILLKLRKRPI